MEQPGIILSGPTELYQGGRGLIGRLAVPLPMGSPSVVAAMVLDLPAVLVDARLNEITTVEWKLVDHRGDRVDGSRTDLAAFAGAPGLAIRLPDREWRLIARPVGGWAAAVTQQQWPVRVTLAVVVGLLTGGGTVDAWLGRHPRDRQRRAVVREEAPGGKPAVFRYVGRTEANLNYWDGE